MEERWGLGRAVLRVNLVVLVVDSVVWVLRSAWVWVSFGVIGVRRGCGISASLSNGVGVGLASLRLRLVTGGATLAD